MNVTIENYRGFDIIFVTDSERFTFYLDGGNWTEKQSYAACKKNIDDYLKQNIDFKPFIVHYKENPNSRYTIIGIRKDGFTYEQGGHKYKFREYDEERYILEEEANQPIYAAIDNLEKQIQGIQDQIGKEYSKIKSPTLKQLREKYIQP